MNGQKLGSETSVNGPHKPRSTPPAPPKSAPRANTRTDRIARYLPRSIMGAILSRKFSPYPTRRLIRGTHLDERSSLEASPERRFGGPRGTRTHDHRLKRPML